MTPRMPPRSQPMSAADVSVRAQSARKFLEVAELVADDGDRTVAHVSASLAVLAGIAASDAICGAVLGQRPQGQDHKQAAVVLATVRPRGKDSAAALRRLLDDKSNAQYGTSYLTPARIDGMLRAARKLVEIMEEQLRRSV